MELVEFIVKAKIHTYASGKKATKLKEGFEEFVFKEGDFEYRDRYHARDPKPFGGQEVVWQNGKAIWIMNYYGYMSSDKINSETLYEFLRKAIGLVDKNKPFRGPSNFKDNKFEYRNQSEGDFNCFKGVEIILLKGKEVYRLEYHGGMI